MSGRGYEKWLETRCILKVACTRFSGRLRKTWEKKKDDTKNFSPNNEKYGVVTSGDRRDHRRKRSACEGV